MSIFWFQFKKMQKELSSSAQFKRDLKRRLDAAWNAQASAPRAWYQFVRFRVSMAVMSAVLVVTCFGTSVYAYNSPEVTEGTALYPLKQTIEKVEEKLQTTPTAKAKFYIKTIDRREAEKKVLEKKKINVQKVEKSIEAVTRKLQTAGDELKSTVSSTESVYLRAQIEQRLERRVQRLDRQKDILKDREEKLRDAISAMGTKTPDRLRKRIHRK